MDYRKVVLAIGLGAIIWVPGVGARQSQKEVPGLMSEAKVIATGLDKDLQKVRDGFLKKDLKGSAAAIRKAGAYLASLEAQAAENREQAYLAGMEGLKIAAKRAEKGTVKSVKELGREFGSSYHALARYHYLRVTEYWAKKETANIGQELSAATANFESGVKEAGGKEKREVRLLIKDARILTAKLVQGAEAINGEVEKGFKAPGAEIEKSSDK
jgi:hypothetical protein